MKNPSIFSVIGPTTRGPSSSHVAGAAKLGWLARKIFPGKITQADIFLYGSFRETGKGHGTPEALASGLLDCPIGNIIDQKDAIHHAKKLGISLNYIYGKSTEDLKYYSNVARFRLGGFVENKEKTVDITGASIGGGDVRIIDIDDYKNLEYMDINGDMETLIIFHKDKPSTAAHILSVISNEGYNIASAYLERKDRGGEAMLLLTLDNLSNGKPFISLGDIDFLKVNCISDICYIIPETIKL